MRHRAIKQAERTDIGSVKHVTINFEFGVKAQGKGTDLFHPSSMFATEQQSISKKSGWNPRSQIERSDIVEVRAGRGLAMHYDGAAFRGDVSC